MHFVKAKGILSAKMVLTCIVVVCMAAFIAIPEAGVIIWSMLLRILKLKKMRLICWNMRLNIDEKNV